MTSCNGVIIIIVLFSRPPSNSLPRWYKFDDNEVIECKMDNDEVGGL